MKLKEISILLPMRTAARNHLSFWSLNSSVSSINRHPLIIVVIRVVSEKVIVGLIILRDSVRYRQIKSSKARRNHRPKIMRSTICHFKLEERILRRAMQLRCVPILQQLVELFLLKKRSL